MGGYSKGSAAQTDSVDSVFVEAGGLPLATNHSDQQKKLYQT